MLFKPAGVPLASLEVRQIALDEVEALRLADVEGLYHEAAAEHMGVSRATFGRIVAEARRKVAEALIGGHALRLHGGNVVMQGEEDMQEDSESSGGRCCRRRRKQSGASEESGRGRGRCSRGARRHGRQEGKGHHANTTAEATAAGENES